VFQRLRLPVVFGYLLAGMIVGLAISSTTIIAKVFEEQNIRGRVRDIVPGVLIIGASSGTGAARDVGNPDRRILAECDQSAWSPARTRQSIRRAT
jgi:hypothetical protein